MEAAAQLEWEARWGRPAAAAAFGSAAMYVASLVLEAPVRSGVDDEREALIEVSEHNAELLASLGARVVSVALLAFAFLYLMRATVARRPELPRIVLPLFFLAPVLLAVGGVIDRLDLVDVADGFTASERQTEKVAEDLLDDRSPVGGAIASGGTISLALSFILMSLNSMRAGLLSRFMGALGMVVGFLTILPIVPIQAFWVFALGFLFLDRWPGGRGPAWETVEAIPWPSAAQVRDAMLLEEKAKEATEEAESAEDEEQPAAPRKRKKKRRGR